MRVSKGGCKPQETAGKGPDVCEVFEEDRQTWGQESSERLSGTKGTAFEELSELKNKTIELELTGQVQ